MFTLVCLNSLLTDGVYRSLRHVRLYFFGTSDSSGPEPAKGGWEAFQRMGWLRPVLVFWGDIFGQLHGNWVPARDKSDGRAAGRVGGGWLARMWGWAPLFSSLRQGNWGVESTCSWPWCQPSALGAWLGSGTSVSGSVGPQWPGLNASS